MSTPRSLESLRRQGLMPSELVFIDYDDFKDRELKTMGKTFATSDEFDEEIIQMRFKFNETKRQEKLRLAKEEWLKIKGTQVDAVSDMASKRESA